jgi:tripartite-type tricarboxylate transporter receptor subunit TctC
MKLAFLLFRNRMRVVACGLLLLMAASSFAQETWPSRPIRLLVGFPPGSSPDFIARAIADPLAKALGQPVIVENRVGASGNIATAAVAQATDQHTLGVVINGNMTVAKLLNPSTPYDPMKDLAPVSLICKAPLLLVAPGGVANGSTKELLSAAKAAGAAWNYGSPGVGTVGHLAMEVFKAKAGIAPVHVPYPSYQRVAMAMMAGEVQISLVQLGAAMPLVESGKLKAIGVTAAARSTLAPAYPTLAEAGMPALELEVWTGIAAPRNMPADRLARLSSVLGEISRSEGVRRQLMHHGYDSVGIDAAGFARRIQSDYEQLAHIIMTQGIKIE